MFNRNKPPRYQAYLLRLWEEGQQPDAPAEWRFSLEDPHSSERIGFKDLDAVISFLRQRMQPIQTEGERK